MYNDLSPPCRAHSAIVVGDSGSKAGNGLQVLNDVWILDVGSSLDSEVGTGGDFGAQVASSREYNTANLVQNVVIVGGGDGRECYGSQPQCVSSLVFTLPS